MPKVINFVLLQKLPSNSKYKQLICKYKVFELLVTHK